VADVLNGIATDLQTSRTCRPPLLRLPPILSAAAGIFSADMTIHFICTGNIYRSRLAEAYCASKGVPGLHVLSSGIGTSLNRGIPIASYAARVLRERGLERLAAPSWQQTTAALVRASDVLVFMEREHYSFCEDWMDPIRQTVEIWDIPDVGPVDAARIMTKVEQTFAMIGQRTDILLTTLGCL
jgi:protein-tyrosine-phosphatase